MATVHNRTLQFHGLAYGNSNVSLTAIINGTTVFSGEVVTNNTPLTAPSSDEIENSPVLFSIPDSPLFPTDFGGSYPMSVIVSNGEGVAMGPINCNYMVQHIKTTAILDNSSIAGNTLTVGSVASGNVIPFMMLTGTGIANVTVTVSDNGNGTWRVGSPNASEGQTVSATTITANGVYDIIGTADTYVRAYHGEPTNSEGTPDPRSSVMIDGIQQVPPRPEKLRASGGRWCWVVESGSTISYNLNVGIGNCAQS